MRTDVLVVHKRRLSSLHDTAKIKRSVCPPYSDTLLSHDSANQLGRRHVEAWVIDAALTFRNALGREKHARLRASFFERKESAANNTCLDRRTLLDRNLCASGDRKVDRSDRRYNDEGNIVTCGEDCGVVGSDFVRRVTVCGDAISANGYDGS